eukprot:TRINITY_DN4240_c0_g1_i1.p1 TRINITY_DN4240_c0_g1~~TRINITY_DN4240_c0_g1_i1.p1  ORF type:complete len:115 (-),score=18.22 TRINITY_DN4240_c0_g1_i1:354-698(-)
MLLLFSISYRLFDVDLLRIDLVIIVFFFFFKQKTAYEMLRSLVGSEMCIRDRRFNNKNLSTSSSKHFRKHEYKGDFLLFLDGWKRAEKRLAKRAAVVVDWLLLSVHFCSDIHPL